MTTEPTPIQPGTLKAVLRELARHGHCEDCNNEVLHPERGARRRYCDKCRIQHNRWTQQQAAVRSRARRSWAREAG